MVFHARPRVLLFYYDTGRASIIQLDDEHNKTLHGLDFSFNPALIIISGD